MPVTDPGIGTGVGGFFTSLLNPGLATRVAQHLTPNPSPLAQQGGPAAPGSVDSVGNPVPPPGSNLPPSAATQPDPVNAPNVAKLSQPDPSYVADFMRYNRMNQLSDDLNRNIQGVAAGFGTAQQQASKTAALGQGGGVGDSLGALAKIQGMQDQTIQDNEHARFMGSAATFAQTLSQSLGRPVSVAEAQTIMNSPELMKSFGGAAGATVGANATETDMVKNAEAATRAWAQANPNASPQDIANYKANLISQGAAGNLSAAGKSLMDDRRQWMQANPGKSFADMIAARPELANEIAYTAQKTEEGKMNAQAGEDKMTAATTFAKVNQSYNQVEATVDWLNDPAHRTAVQKAIATPGLFTRDTFGNLIADSASGLTGIDQDVLDARSKLDFLKNELYKDNFTGTHNIRSNTEANKIAGAATNLDTKTNSAATINQQLTQLQQQVYREQANAAAAAGKVVPYKYHGLADQTYLDPKSRLYQGGSEEVPATVTSPDDVAKLPSGRAFVVPSGPHKGEVGYAP